MTDATGQTINIGEISLTVIEDRLIPRKSWGGIVIGRIQKIRNNVTGEVSVVNFWYENEKLHHVA